MRPPLCLAVIAIGACSNAGSDLGPVPFSEWPVEVEVFLDRDASGGRTSADTIVGTASVSLRPPGGGQAVQTVVTNTAGVARFQSVPVGEYSLSVDPASLGDSISVAEVIPVPLEVVVTANPIEATIRLKFPEFSVRQARQQPPGKRIMIRGLVLAGVQSFRDTTSHVRDTSGQVRLTRVSLSGGLTGNDPGDSVAVLGTVSSRAGQPTLDQVRLYFISSRPAPVALALSTAAAAAASGGTLDAGLVRITGAVIAEAAVSGPDFRVVANDGSGPLTVIVDGNIQLNPVVFVVGRTLNVTGVLVPDGTGQWRLKPRTAGDIAVF